LQNEQAGKSFYMFAFGAVLMLSSFAAPFWIMYVFQDFLVIFLVIRFVTV